MSMTGEDIERIGEIVETKMTKCLEPIHLRCERHTQTLYGPNGSGGVVGELKEAKTKINTFITLSSMIQGGLAVIVFFRKQIFGN
jgi:hypothetical protein